MKSRNRGNRDWYALLPIVFLVAVVPLIVFCKKINLEGAMYEYWVGGKENYDFFSYYKSVWIIISTIAAIFTFLIKSYISKGKIKKVWMYIPLSVYALFVMLSALLSEYKNVSFFGFTDRHEGMFVILSYVIILFIVINIVNGETHIKAILYSLFASAFLMGIIGVFQYFNMDLFQSNFGKSLILPQSMQKFIEDIQFTLGPRTVYGTLYHYNYMGSYMAMVFPLTFVLFMYTKEKKHKVVFGILTLLTAFNWFACRSRAGLVGGAFAFLIFIIVSRKSIIKNWKIFVPAALSIVVIFIGANAMSNGSITKRIGEMMLDLESTTDGLQYTHGIKDIVVEKNKVKIDNNTENLIAVVEGTTLHFEDENGNKVHVSYDENGQILFKDDRYKDYKFIFKQSKGYNVLSMQISNDKMNFAITPEGFKYIAGNGVLVDPKPIETWGFEGRERMGSSRAYIWSRAIPLIKNTVLVGHGPDTFAIYFPQYDYIGKLKAYQTTNIIVDKPHDLYLQNAINTGLVSLIALLVLFIGYFVQSMKAYFNNDMKNFCSVAGLGIFLAVCGYLGAGVFNDSVVSVAPVFWILLGVGISINLKILNSNSPEPAVNSKKR